MESETTLIISTASQLIEEQDVPFKVDFYKLEGGERPKAAAPRSS